ncbi:type II toxin-antitoxin system VapC family toxin [Methylococcus sp. Mc7]|nr:type II toxin-antitoxin system VapC family toxin [Methylococcus sp. Mc7]QXP83325.1 type II toxin-antitoxin system VapC family toxin [Methylococcus sp. Mc7]
MVVLDTHVLVWWTLDPAKLSAIAKRHCDAIASAGAAISSISLWEVGIKVKRGQLDLGIDFADYVRRLQLVKGLKIVPVDADHWMANLELQWEHRDPADRTIVATAKLFDLPLLSKDEIVRAFYAKAIW